MRAAYLIVDGQAAMEHVLDVWRSLGATESSTTMQIESPDGYLFHVDKDDRDPIMTAEWHNGLVESGSAGQVPDVDSAVACLVSCRSKSVYADYVGQAAAGIPGRAWVLDGNDVLWPAESIDPARIVL